MRKPRPRNGVFWLRSLRGSQSWAPRVQPHAACHPHLPQDASGGCCPCSWPDTMVISGRPRSPALRVSLGPTAPGAGSSTRRSLSQERGAMLEERQGADGTRWAEVSTRALPWASPRRGPPSPTSVSAALEKPKAASRGRAAPHARPSQESDLLLVGTCCPGALKDGRTGAGSAAGSVRLRARGLAAPGPVRPRRGQSHGKAVNSGFGCAWWSWGSR